MRDEADEDRSAEDRSDQWVAALGLREDRTAKLPGPRSRRSLIVLL